METGQLEDVPNMWLTGADSVFAERLSDLLEISGGGEVVGRLVLQEGGQIDTMNDSEDNSFKCIGSSMPVVKLEPFGMHKQALELNSPSEDRVSTNAQIRHNATMYLKPTISLGVDIGSREFGNGAL